MWGEVFRMFGIHWVMQRQLQLYSLLGEIGSGNMTRVHGTWCRHVWHVLCGRNRRAERLRMLEILGSIENLASPYSLWLVSVFGFYTLFFHFRVPKFSWIFHLTFLYFLWYFIFIIVNIKHSSISITFALLIKKKKFKRYLSFQSALETLDSWM